MAPQDSPPAAFALKYSSDLILIHQDSLHQSLHGFSYTQFLAPSLSESGDRGSKWPSQRRPHFVAQSDEDGFSQNKIVPPSNVSLKLNYWIYCFNFLPPAFSHVARSVTLVTCTMHWGHTRTQFCCWQMATVWKCAGPGWDFTRTSQEQEADGSTWRLGHMTRDPLLTHLSVSCQHWD